MPREARLVVSPEGLCPEITLQADLGGFSIAFVERVSGLTSDELDARLDAYRKMISRQRAQQALVECLVDLQSRREALAKMPEREREFSKERVAERARLVASFEAAHNVAGKRAAFSMNAAQRKGLHDFDAQTDVDRKKKFEDEKAKIEAEIPVYEAQVARQRAIIAGRERADVIEGPQAEAAD